METNNRSYFLLHYEIILVTKNKKKIFNPETIAFLVENFKGISKKYLIEYMDISYEGDHVHISFKSQPKSELVKFITAFKNATSKRFKKKFSNNFSENEVLWERTYFLLTKEACDAHLAKKFMDMKINCMNN